MPIRLRNIKSECESQKRKDSSEEKNKRLENQRMGLSTALPTASETAVEVAAGPPGALDPLGGRCSE